MNKSLNMLKNGVKLLIIPSTKDVYVFCLFRGQVIVLHGIVAVVSYFAEGFWYNLPSDSWKCLSKTMQQYILQIHVLVTV